MGWKNSLTVLSLFAIYKASVYTAEHETLFILIAMLAIAIIIAIILSNNKKG